MLNINDSEPNRFALSRILERAGCEVLEAGSGREGLSIAREQAAALDLILLDIKLPDLHGFEVCRILRNDSSTCMIPVLEISATYIEVEDRVHGLESGADAYLSQSVEPQELIATARALLRVRRAERALREADRRKDEFLAILAHELRTPLAPIQNAMEILRQHAPGDRVVMRQQRIVERQVTQMRRLLDDLLDLSRFTRGGVELQLERVVLQEVLEMAVEAASPLIERNGHHLRVSLPEDPVPVAADRGRMAQVFVNLLNNAAKYTDRGGRIELLAERQPEGVVVRVRDSGIGMDAAALQQAFGLFSQEQRALTRSEGGLGIGLALVRTLVELHGGKVSATSEGPGRGSEFTVWLPIEPAAPAA